MNRNLEQQREHARTVLKPYHFKPGQSGNPKGPVGKRGYSIPAYMSVLTHMTRNELEQIINDPRAQGNKVSAAICLLRARTFADVADFEDVWRKGVSLKELRDRGVDTTLVKKVTCTKTKQGDKITLEFHDWCGEWIDRVLDRTVGRPTQSVDMNQNVTHHIKVIERQSGVDRELPGD